MIIGDENIEQYWIDLLRSNQYNVYSLKEKHPGLSDTAIISLVKIIKGVLLTEDKILVNWFLLIQSKRFPSYFYATTSPTIQK